MELAAAGEEGKLRLWAFGRNGRKRKEKKFGRDRIHSVGQDWIVCSGELQCGPAPERSPGGKRRGKLRAPSPTEARGREPLGRCESAARPRARAGGRPASRPTAFTSPGCPATTRERRIPASIASPARDAGGWGLTRLLRQPPLFRWDEARGGRRRALPARRRALPRRAARPASPSNRGNRGRAARAGGGRLAGSEGPLPAGGEAPGR